jgi:hypothetical protein
LTPGLTIAFLVLWLVLGALATLVLLLFRQVDRAYKQNGRMAGVQLKAGVGAPAVEVMRGDGVELLSLDMDDRHLLVFVNSTCDSCKQLIGDLLHRGPRVPSTAILIEGTGFQELIEAQVRHPEMRVEALADMGDAQRLWGVTRVPFVYVLRGRTILAGGVASSTADITTLLEDASREEARLSDDTVSVRPTREEVAK